MKKAQGLSLNTIIIALLVLLVLIVVGFIFMTQTNVFRGGLKECSGTCVDAINKCPGGALGVYMKGCDDGSGNTGNNYCCPKEE